VGFVFHTVLAEYLRWDTLIDGCDIFAAQVGSGLGVNLHAERSTVCGGDDREFYGGAYYFDSDMGKVKWFYYAPEKLNVNLPPG
jgi:hypothetical protein